MVQPIQIAEASPEVRAVYDDIMATRGLTDVNNFWKYLAHDPATLRRTWESIKEVMRPGELDPLVKEMLYLAVSMTNGCNYCIASHTALRPSPAPRSSAVPTGRSVRWVATNTLGSPLQTSSASAYRSSHPCASTRPFKQRGRLPCES